MNAERRSELLRRLAGGELEPLEEAALRERLSQSPDAQAELALWQALPQAARGTPPDEADWEHLETLALSALRTPAPAPKPWRVPALAFGSLLVIVSLLLVFVWPGGDPAPDSGPLPVSDLEPPKGKVQFLVPPHLAFDTGRFETTGKRAPIALDFGTEGAQVEVRSLARGQVQGRDRIETGADQVVAFRLYERARLVLGPESLLEFREFGDSVAPFLVRGSLAVAVDEAGEPPLVVLCQHARLVDIGTVFQLRSDGRGRGVLAVREGRVRLERPGQGLIEVAPQTRALWEGPILAANLAPGLAGDDPDVLLAYAAPPTPPPQAAPPSPRKPTPPPDAAVPAPEAAAPAVSVTLSDAEAEITSWQETLDSLPLLQLQRIGVFYERVEAQMNGGMTLRAIAELEAFIESNPGPVSEKARYLLGECHYALQDWERARSQFLDYMNRHPRGAWVEMARFRFAELAGR